MLEARADQLLDLAIGVAHQVLHALVLDVELVALTIVSLPAYAQMARPRAQTAQGDEEALLEPRSVMAGSSWAGCRSAVRSGGRASSSASFEQRRGSGRPGDRDLERAPSTTSTTRRGARVIAV